MKTAQELKMESWELSPELLKELDLLIKDIEYVKEKKVVNENTFHKINAIYQQISGLRDHITIRVFNMLKRGDKID